ncbi:LacI family DNA-binding transcriptional regulator [Flavihumibacter fluvii]|uniref:LacI family DNA-binding transcriptional regulator n=1 Tax=Flavihumibacter fluvii TaxID=2838157 RepID=UPI001BDE0317|nr:substrate-binding domain-containing protein [Flavihumibacter fluvii]ULQ52731.1 substrate-binding domain-containing protein [Flavihumibacter fluvii]
MTKQASNELIGVKEIARRANVSIGTVDRVLHNRSGVSEKTRNKINQIIAELNYQPNILARRLASRNVLQFAVLIPAVSPESDYWTAPIDGVLQAAAELKPFGIQVLIFLYNQNDKQTFLEQVKKVKRKKVDAVLLAPFFIDAAIEFTDECKSAGIPFVFINSDIPNQGSLCYIGPNLFQSGHLAAQLVNFNVPANSKILVVNISHEIKNSSFNRLLRKEEGFRAFFEKWKISQQIIRLDIRKTSEVSVVKKISEVVQANPDLKAVFVTNSRVGSVAAAIHQQKKDDLFLVGYDYLDDNNDWLRKGVIKFLICHKPQEQGYKGIMTLYQNLVLGQAIAPVYYMPIDIVSSENQEFYRN